MMINGRMTGMPTSRSDFGFHVKDSRELHFRNDLSMYPNGITAKSMKALKISKSPHNSLSKINGKKISNIINDEQNTENAIDYCEKLRYQQAKMFWNNSNREIRHRVYKKFKPNNPQFVTSKSDVYSTDTDSGESGCMNSLVFNTEDQIKSKILTKNPLKQQELQKNQIVDLDQLSDSETKLELMVCPKINDVIDGFERSSKRWTSMYALRDSFRNLASCVSSRNRFAKKKENFQIKPQKSDKNMNESKTIIPTIAKPTTTTTYNSDYESFNKIIVYDDDDYDDDENDLTINNDIFFKDRKKTYIEKSFTSPNVASILNNNNNFELKEKFDYYDDDEYNKEQLSNNSIDTNKIVTNNIFKRGQNNLSLTRKQINKKKISNNVDDLCEIIEKVQGTRLENQRCELTQDLNSATILLDIMLSKNQNKLRNDNINSIDNTETDKSQNILTRQSTSRSMNYNPERLFKILSTDSTLFDEYPMISLPDNNTYWSDGWNTFENSYNNINPNNSFIYPKTYLMLNKSIQDIRKSNYDSPSSDESFTNQQQNNVTLADDENILKSIQNLKTEAIFSKTTIMDKDHLDFYGQDINNFPIILSYKIENSSSLDYIKAILRLKDETIKTDLPFNIKDPITPHQICKIIQPDLKIKFLNPILIPTGTKLIKNFDEHSISKTHKFGIIYMKRGQTNEEELFSNQAHSEGFEEFLNFIGKRIKLKDFKGFKGGLDTNHGQTGEESVYEEFDEKEIMFHVSTLLPYSKTDSQQLERKRHIGNDIVTIIFQDENTPFAPDMIASNFLHSFIVIQKCSNESSSYESNTNYRIAVCARNGVPNFLPEIPKYATFEKSKLFKEWLFMKLINAETACCKAEKFKKLKERTRFTLLDELYKELNQQNVKIMQSIQMNNSINENNSDIVFESQSQNSFSSSTSKNEGTVATINPTQHHHSSAGFKFNLFHNVRKAFNIKSHKSSTASESSKTTLSSTSSNSSNEHVQTKENKPAFTLPHNLPPIYSYSIMNNNNNNNIKGRIRSVTVDTPSQIKYSSKSLKEKHDYTHGSNGKVTVLPDYEKVINQQNFVNKNNSKSTNDGSQIDLTSDSIKQPITSSSSSSQESSPKSSNSLQNRNEMNEFSFKKKHYNFSKNRNNNSNLILTRQDNVLFIEDSDTGLGSITPNSSGISSVGSIVLDANLSSGISSSTSFVTDQSVYENTSDTLTTLYEADLKVNNSYTSPLNSSNNSNKKTNNSDKNYFNKPKRRAETINDQQFLKIKGQENTNILSHNNEVF